MNRMPAPLGASRLAVALLAVSCTTLGTHVKGGFACRAPVGTCAPMSGIDAQAIAGLGASGGSDMPISSETSDGQARFLTTGADGVPVRTGERVMRVVFPAHTDGQGVYHEEAVAHVVSERSAWTLRPTDAPDADSLGVVVARDAPVPDPPVATAVSRAASDAVAAAAPLILREAAAGLAAPVEPMPGPDDPDSVPVLD